MGKIMNLLIADDETLIREGIKHLLSGEECGYRIAAEAANGVEALRICDEQSIDIILADIKMPVMDGFELIRQLQAKSYPAKVVILSCHADFFYAQEAIKLGALDYILKMSITYDELLKVLDRVRNSIEGSDSIASEAVKIRKQLDMHKFEIKSKFVGNVITGVLRNREVIKEKISLMGMKLDEGNMICAVMDICGGQILDGKYNGKDIKLLEATIINLINEILEDKGVGEVFGSVNAQFIIIASYPSLKSQSSVEGRFLEMLSYIKNCLVKYLSAEVSIGISRVHSGFDKICELYGEAEAAAGFKFHFGSGAIIRHDGERHFSTIDYSSAEDRRKKVIEAVCSRDIKTAAQLLKEAYDSFHEQYIVPDDVRNFTVDLIAGCADAFKELCDDEKAIQSLFPGKKYDEVFRIDNINDLSAYANNFIVRLAELIGSVSSVRYRKEIAKAIDYIDRNYSQNITLPSVAAHVNMSVNYFCQLFRQGTGENLIDYINRVRVAKAKEYLRMDSTKVNDVAERVGIPDPRYFSKVFKKVTGMSPSEFKNKVFFRLPEK